MCGSCAGRANRTRSEDRLCVDAMVTGAVALHHSAKRRRRPPSPPTNVEADDCWLAVVERPSTKEFVRVTPKDRPSIRSSICQGRASAAISPWQVSPRDATTTPPPVRGAFKQNGRSLTGLRGRRPFARYAHPRPWSPQGRCSRCWLGQPSWRYMLECDQTAADTVSDSVYPRGRPPPARRLSLQTRRHKSRPSIGIWQIIVSCS
jgi:hypothetical protein